MQMEAHLYKVNSHQELMVLLDNLHLMPKPVNLGNLLMGFLRQIRGPLVDNYRQGKLQIRQLTTLQLMEEKLQLLQLQPMEVPKQG